MNAHRMRSLARWARSLFHFLRPPLLPEDPRFMGTTLAQIRMPVPGLESWLQKMFTVMGGFMASASVLTVFVEHSSHAAAIEGNVLGHRSFWRAHGCANERN